VDGRNGGLAVYTQWNWDIQLGRVKTYICPSDPTQDNNRWGEKSMTSYAYNGQVFTVAYPWGWGQGSRRYPAQITDGTTNTIFFTDHAVDYTYYGDGTRGWAPSGGWGYWPDWGGAIASVEAGQPTGGNIAGFQVQPNPSNYGDGNRGISFHTNGINVGLGDGSVRFVSANITPRTWWAAMTPQGGEVLGSDW
jgi:prepilin-type processing-associated H-X9-DG protein